MKLARNTTLAVVSLIAFGQLGCSQQPDSLTPLCRSIGKKFEWVASSLSDVTPPAATALKDNLSARPDMLAIDIAEACAGLSPRADELSLSFRKSHQGARELLRRHSLSAADIVQLERHYRAMASMLAETVR